MFVLLPPWGRIMLFGVFLYIFRRYTVFEDRREWNRTELEQLERDTACSGCELGRETYRGGTRHGTRRVPRRAPGNTACSILNTACPDEEKWAKSYRGRTRPGIRRVPRRVLRNTACSTWNTACSIPDGLFYPIPSRIRIRSL